MMPIGMPRKVVHDTGANAPHLIKPRYLDGLLTTTTGRTTELAKNIMDHAALESGHRDAVVYDRTSIGGDHFTSKGPGVAKSHAKKSATEPKRFGQVPYSGPKY